ncbi:MAG: hypothetical protein ACJA08_001626 [Cyclobacteriaceae bacterium]|jgi:hypothetical protein
MKKSRLYIFLSLSILFVGCNESEDLITSNAVSGGLMNVTTTSVNYVVGNTGPYPVEFFLNQNESVNIETIMVYKTFIGQEILKDKDDEDSVIFNTSNEVLDREIPVTNKTNHYVTAEFTFEELSNGLELKGAPLPASDGSFLIGDSWRLRIETKLSDGRTLTQRFTISITVSTRFAGVYNVVEKQYYRINTLRDDLDSQWPETMTIASIDAITYELVEYIGLFNANTLYFQIDPGTGKITYPAQWNGVDQILNDLPIITCDLNPNDLLNMPCASSNVAIIKDNGKDVLDMVVGYIASTGSREFHQRLEKVVE